MGRIVVVGSYNRDTVLAVPHFPAPGETLAALGMNRFHGGKGSNQAVAASRAGADVAMVAAVGADAAGDGALALWAHERIDAVAVARLPDLPTGEAIILVDAAGENQIVIIPGANAALRADAAVPALGGASIVIAQLETPLPATLAAFGAARRRGVTTMLNAAPATPLPAELLDLADLLVVNETEAAGLLGGTGAPAELAVALAPRHRRGVVLTAGAAGAYWAGPAGTALHMPSRAVAVVDSTGAGDAFIGAFAAGLAGGLDEAASLRRGVAAGALACGRAGAVPSLPRLAEIEAALQ